MRTEHFEYHLPPELIAQTPLPRGESRLLVLERHTGRITHAAFRQFPEYLRSDDVLVLNDTRVIARRLKAVRANGREAEALLLRRVGEREADALVRPGRPLKTGASLGFVADDGQVITVEIAGVTDEGGRRLRFESAGERDRAFHSGDAPLPPYIGERLIDEERYQTVYGSAPGSAAAPTAGLHFTQSMLAELRSGGVRTANVTLHVGVDTFRPVKAEDVKDHKMHGERYHVSTEDAAAINAGTGRVIAVGTTTVRVLETTASELGDVVPGEGVTRLFITPGYPFKVVDALLTNFHLPRSTLLMLVSAFAGRENVLRAYNEAVARRYRFFSFGDAMLVI